MHYFWSRPTSKDHWNHEIKNAFSFIEFLKGGRSSRLELEFVIYFDGTSRSKLILIIVNIGKILPVLPLPTTWKKQISRTLDSFTTLTRTVKSNEKWCRLPYRDKMYSLLTHVLKPLRIYPAFIILWILLVSFFVGWRISYPLIKTVECIGYSVMTDMPFTLVRQVVSWIPGSMALSLAAIHDQLSFKHALDNNAAVSLLQHEDKKGK